MKGVTFVPFPKPHINRAKSERWIKACKREHFRIDSITKHTYICSLRFIGGNGSTDEYPDPVDATASPAQVSNLYRKLVLGLSRLIFSLTITIIKCFYQSRLSHAKPMDLTCDVYE
ncbi:hypothetical protein LSH36_1237g00000 [Paralvinella palmiformis]|uniref:THAP-type domain-containing protein n=1 Tax=Paralvinella palmiformis TaxID=53620 RepID=A0AAD9ITS7_9ANNE|nr:hypothetical protein LSH36_1237g00000 [Paralvinella palmiformis]